MKGNDVPVLPGYRHLFGVNATFILLRLRDECRFYFLDDCNHEVRSVRQCWTKGGGNPQCRISALRQEGTKKHLDGWLVARYDFIRTCDRTAQKQRQINLFGTKTRHHADRCGNFTHFRRGWYPLNFRIRYSFTLPGHRPIETMIDERCRDCTFDTFTNIIDVCVNYLRKKMDSRRYSKLEFTYSSTSSIFF